MYLMSRHPALDILAVGQDMSALGQLMTYGGSFASRCTMHCMAGDLCGSTKKEAASIFIDGKGKWVGSNGKVGVTIFRTGGNLVLAKGGVCLVGNHACLRKDQVDKLQQSEYG